MKSIKLMLLGIMLMLVAFCAVLIDYGNNTWLQGLAVILMLVSILVFLVGLFTRT